MAQRIITLILLAFFPLTPASASLFGNKTTFMPVDKAFIFDFQQQAHQVLLHWQIAPGYYLYRQQIKIVPQNAQLAPVTLPSGLAHHDEFYGETSIFRTTLQLPIELLSTKGEALLLVSYQGCADAGFCYPPETQKIPLTAVTLLAHPSVEPVKTATLALEPTGLPFSPFWAFLIGIGISLTPCVLPMYPLISAIILGQQRPQSLRRVFFLSMVYVQGMAVTYTLLGIVVAAVGLQFQAMLQHPAVLIGISLLFIVLAFSMFGLFTLQLPSSLQTRLAQWSHQQSSGSLLGVFIMGALAGLICSPCTTAPLSAILLYIAQSGNTLAGGGILYLYALGMGLPLILLTTFGNHLLPRSGSWMQHVKEAFGFVILAMPIFLLDRVLGSLWGIRLWSLLGIAFFIWGFVLSLRTHHYIARILQILLLASALISARPLQDWVWSSSATQVTITPLAFQPITSLTELNQALTQARAQHQPVMLDFYADWCIACKELEKYTFTDSEVRQLLANFRLLRVDATENNAQHEALLKHFNVLGLPSILFFNPNGEEQPLLRVNGFISASDFKAHLPQIQ